MLLETIERNMTYNDASFSREYESTWSGDMENAFFSGERFDRNRKILQPEYSYSGRRSNSTYYVIGVDVGRHGCTTEALIIKVNPNSRGGSTKSLVNIYTFEAEHFEEQAINIKKLYYKYNPRCIAIDANGLKKLGSCKTFLIAGTP